MTTWILLSPLLVLAVGRIAGTFAARLPSRRWAWVLPVLAFWLTIALLIAWGAPAGTLARWTQAPTGAWGWAALAVGIGLAPLPIFLTQTRLLRSWSVFLPWIAFALINGTLEEAYWRGLLLDATSGWSPWLAVLYTSVVFALNHPVTFGAVSPPLRHVSGWGGAFAMGIAWGWVYLQTGSLWWTVGSHILINLASLVAPTFMGLYTPPTGLSRRTGAA